MNQRPSPRQSAIALIGLLIILTFAVGCASPTESVQPPIIGIMAPLTGPNAPLGAQMLQGIELAANETGRTLHLVIEDDQCDAKTGVTITQKLITVDHVDAIIGPICTVAILPSASIIEDARVPRITAGMVVQKTAEAGPYHFSYLPEFKHQMRAIAHYTQEHGIRTVGVIALDDDLGHEGISELKTALATVEITVSAEEYFVKTESDYRTMLTKIKATTPDAVYVFGFTPHMIHIIKTIDELGIDGPILSWNLMRDPATLDLGTLASRVVFTYPEDPSDLPSQQAFKQKFRDAYGTDPSLYASNAYDSYKILLTTLNTCAGDRDCVVATLGSVTNYSGANGVITVDERGVGQRSEVSLLTVREHAFVLAG